MNSPLNVINRAFLVFLYLRSVWTAFIPSEGPQVIKFMDVWNKSYCRPIETLVEILQEYPDQVVYILKPACVPLLRCGGCCNDETLECVPTELHNVTMQIMKIKPHHAEHITEMHFAQHSKCVCRPKRESIKPPKSRCEPCTQRRKHLFVQDQQTCICSCKITQLRCKSKGLELNVRSCRCTKPRR